MTGAINNTHALLFEPGHVIGPSAIGLDHFDQESSPPRRG